MNLLPSASQKRVRSELRARFLLGLSAVLLSCAALFALALVPAEASLVFFSPPQMQTSPGSGDTAQDNTAIAHTQALLTATQPFAATSSLDDVLAALSQQGPGIKIDDISYSITQKTLSISGQAQAPSDVNTFRENLETDLRFQNVSVPVSALLGSQGGSFTITMDVTQ